MDTNNNPTPYEHYKKLKEKHPEAMLLFRNGNAYNLFQENARTAGQLLDIIVYIDNDPHDIYYWTGFAGHMLDEYLPKLIKAGHRVAICDLYPTR